MRDSLGRLSLGEGHFISCHFCHVLKGTKLEVVQDAFPSVRVCWTGAVSFLRGPRALPDEVASFGIYVGFSWSQFEVS